MATDFRTLLVRAGSYRFERIAAGHYELSIQAGYSCYSEPKTAWLNPMAYSKFEVAVFKDGKWELFEPGNVLSEGPWMEYVGRTYYGEMRNNVLVYVPVEVVQKLYERLLELSN